MKVLSASSFHVSSTRDVWQKVNAGLEANGVEVVPFDLMQRYQLYAFLHGKLERSKMKIPQDWAPTTLAYEVLLGAAVFHECDTVLIVSPQYLPVEIPQMMRRVGLKTAAFFTECPYEDTIHTPIVASVFDYAFVNDRHSVGLFEAFCEHVEYVPHCYDPKVQFPSEEERDENVIFIGTGYQSRVKFMKQVDWPARLDLYGWWPKEWLRYGTPLRKCVRSKSTTTPEETADLYRKAAVAFSLHREARYVGTDESIMRGEAYSLGPRNWELAACGTFQVSDFRQELVDVFGDSVPLYETPAELTALLKRAFNEPGWRQEMAQRQTEAAEPYSCERVMRTVAQALAA